MSSLVDFEREKLELQSLLASGVFNRAPNLELLLKYVCSRYFEGEADQIKEYNIAVDALGRPPEFDQRADSIVRVELHRLRKRLREYYEGDGAEHPIHIEIPPGQYAPRFQVHAVPAAPEAAAADSEPAPRIEEPPALPPPDIRAEPLLSSRTPRRNLWIGACAVVIAVIGLILLGYRNPGHARRLPAPGNDASVSGPPTDAIRILCGLEHGTYIDRYGYTWSGDEYFEGGTAQHTANHPIRGTRDPKLYNTRREGSFRYDIPLKPGIYELRLHFAETVYGENNAAGGGESSRVFTVAINGHEALRDFDVIADAGASMADIKVFRDISPAPDGKLHLQFEGRSNPPILSGIEITPGVAGRTRPIRMVAGDHPYTDRDGRYWEPDRYALGGQLVIRTDEISGTPDPDLYRGERFGNISYPIPVADGHYSITLHFSETWFGPGKAGGGPGPGNRVFDILCNGVAVRRNFDIYKEAGGADRAATLTIPDVVPNHQGKLVISLVPVTNYASINAIEIVDVSK